MTVERWPELGSPEDAARTHRWARECLLMWEAEREKFIDGLAVLYRTNPTGVADVCDTMLDTTGALFSQVREKARR